MKLKVLLLAGAVSLAAGAALAPARAFGNLLLASFFLLGLGLAGLVFVALEYACGASWSVAFRRVPEALATLIPIGGAGVLAVLLFHPWGHEPLTGFRGAWLSRPFLVARASLFLAVWCAFALAILKNSRRQDADGDTRHTHRNARLSIAFLVVFAITFWLASYDWIMALEPHWYSTIFGVYNFAGLFASGLAAIVLLVLWLRRSGTLSGFVNEEHLHDLGKLLFAFSTFWMYIWFSQYMLIWYANITEETVYYVRRQQAHWGPLFLLNMLLNWAVPFVALLPRGTKRTPRRLAIVAAIVLIGRWLDLYLMILPAVVPGAPAFGLPEIGITAAGLAVFLMVFPRALAQAPPVPLNDPYLVESLHYHN